MASIDERVVEMRFNREDFLRGTEQTMEALNRLDSTLSGGGGIADGVQQIGSRMGAMGALAFTALNRLGNAAIDSGIKLAKFVMDPLFEGGKRRALNLEQANFQLMGILKDAGAVEAVMENVSYAVDGTAYGLDAAAVAAAQFAASGMKAGDDMANALRGISGVAAMAGSSYEDVSSIFTKVAGQGRLMGDDLNRLAARGVNAAATLVEYFQKTGKAANVTEADIREMVSKGQIDFATFSDAMNMAFGEHATKANETYTGSLSNLRAALARVSAPVFTMEHEKMRRIFNALRPAVNAFQKALEPLYRIYERYVAIPMAESFERWGAALEKFNFDGLIRTLSEFILLGIKVKDIVMSWISPIGAAFRAIFSPPDASGGWMSRFADFLFDLRGGLDRFKASAEQAGSIQAFFMGIFESIRSFGESVGRFFGDIRDEFQRTGSVLETVGFVFRRFYEMFIEPVVSALTQFKDALKSVSTDGLDGFGEKISNAFGSLTGVREWLDNIGSGIKDFFGGLKDPLAPLKSQVPTIGSAIGGILSGISSAFQGSGMMLGEVFGALGGVLSTMVEQIGGFLQGVSIADIERIGSALIKLAIGFQVYKSLGSLQEVFGSVTNFFNEGAAAFGRFNQETKSESFLKVAAGIGILAGALWLLSGIPATQLAKSAITLGILAGALVGLMFAMDKIDGTSLAKAAFGLGLFAGALLGVSLAVAALGLLPLGALIQGVSAVLVLMGAMTLLAPVLAGNSKGLIGASIGLGMMAGALTLLTIPIAIFGRMDLLTLGQGLLAAALAIGAMVLVAPLLAGHAKNLMMASIGLGMMAGALALLTIPIAIFGRMDLLTLGQGLLGVVVAIGAIALMAPLLAGQGMNMIVASVGLGMMAGALTLLTIPISILGGMDLLTLGQGLLGIVVAIGAIALAALMLGQRGGELLIGALGVGAMALALTLLVTPIEQLGAMSFDQLIQGIGALAGALLLMVGAAFALSGLKTGSLGLIALAVALWIMGDALARLSDIPLGAAAGGLLILSAGLGVLLLAALGAQAVLPGILGLAVLMIAFGAAALMVGAGIAIAAVGFGLMVSIAPQAIQQLIALVQVAPFIAQFSGHLIVAGAALAIFGAGAAIVAVAGLALGLALVLIGSGMMMVGNSSSEAGPKLVAFVDAITPLIWDVLAIAGVAAALLGLGAALLVLGAGMIVAGAGGILLGIGAIAAGAGIAIMMGLAALVAPLADGIAVSFGKLGAVAPSLERFGDAAQKVAGQILIFNGNAQDAVATANNLQAAILILGIVFGSVATSASDAASRIAAAMASIGSSIESSRGVVESGTKGIISALQVMVSNIRTQGGQANAAVLVMVAGMSSNLVVGAVLITSSANRIVQAFVIMNANIKTIGSESTRSVTLMMTSMSRSIMTGERGIRVGVRAIGMAFQPLPGTIRQNGSRAVAAVATMMSQIRSRVSAGASSLRSAGYTAGAAIGNGMVAGVRSQAGRVAGAARNMAASAASSARAALKIASPSKVFEEIGNFTVDGFVAPFYSRADDVDRAAIGMSNEMVDAFSDAFSDIDTQLDAWDKWDFHPTVTPILDTRALQGQRFGIGQTLGVGINSGANLASSIALLEEAMSRIDGSEPTPEPKVVNYNQYNNSPKALDAEEIYRNTRNLISLTEERDR